MTFLFIADSKYCSQREQQLLASLAAHLQNNKENQVILSPKIDNYFDNIVTEDISEALRMACIPSVTTIIPIKTPSIILEKIENPVTWSTDPKSNADLIQTQNVLCHLGKYTQSVEPISQNNRQIVIHAGEKISSEERNLVNIDDEVPIKDLDLLFTNSKEIIATTEFPGVEARALVHGCQLKGNFIPDLQMFETSSPSMDMPDLYKQAFTELLSLENILSEASVISKSKKKSIPNLDTNSWLEEEISCLDNFLTYEKQKKNMKMVEKVESNIFIKICFILFYYLTTPFYFLIE